MNMHEIVWGDGTRSRRNKRRQKVEKGTGAPTRELHSELARSPRSEPDPCVILRKKVDAGSEDPRWERPSANLGFYTSEHLFTGVKRRSHLRIVYDPVGNAQIRKSDTGVGTRAGSRNVEKAPDSWTDVTHRTSTKNNKGGKERTRIRGRM